MKRQTGFDWEKLELLDQAARISRLQARARELAGGEMTSFSSDDASADVLEQFWRRVVQFEEESQGLSVPLRLSPIDFPDPDGLHDEELTTVLWQKIKQLAERRIFLEQTDHLSDRELYEVISGTEMRELTTEPVSSDCAIHFDILGGCSKEDIELYLKYYADDLDRDHWKEQWPDEEFPPKERLLYQRDIKLPKSHPIHETKYSGSTPVE